MLMVLEMAPEMNGCAAAIMRMWLSTERSLAGAPARIGAVEHAVMLGFEMRRALDRHRAADMDVGRLDLALGKAEMGEEVEARRGEILGLDAELVAQKVDAQRPFVEGEFDVEGGRERLLHLLDRLRREAFGLERSVIDGRRLAERAMADGVDDDLGDLAFAIAERAQRRRHRAVDDLEIAAAGELLEFHQREIRLDAGGVAIHNEADRAGRRDHARLRIAVAMRLAERQRAVPGAFGV